ncbi:GNAT family N-acetyltransferase [Paenibacillus sp. GXUN7292]|uniref:GNAT family N-acetyltransferase n=2 Tax=unclassified Paenibacillus TaxID=185978 RepID=UPI003D7DC68B
MDTALSGGHRVLVYSKLVETGLSKAKITKAKQVLQMKLESIFSDLPTLETDRTILRKIRLEDAQDMFAYCSDDDVAKYTTWYKHLSIEDTKSFINHLLGRYELAKVSPWGIQDKLTGRLIGTCGFVQWNSEHASAELGYALSKTYWNQGYMTEIVKKIIDFGFTATGLIRIEARCLVDNIGSAMVMEKSGMRLEGVFRKVVYTKGIHQDLKVYSIIKPELL